MPNFNQNYLTLCLTSIIFFCSFCTIRSFGQEKITPAALNADVYLPLLKDKKVACVVNQTSMVGDKHLIDYLLENNVDIISIFAPEHGFRGKEDAGEKVKSTVDEKTNLQIISLYGDNRKPTPKQMKRVDVVVFDIQDVGVRFYTYISTLTYVMEACGENNVELIVLDRPNPNGHYIDGPILKPEYKSFVGLHPVPIVYGMTIGEYAKMVKGEQWINQAAKLNLTVVPCNNYSHKDMFELPVKPSPNLPNLRSILLYPSICIFEATPVSIGRGTNKQFQVIGHPELKNKPFEFTPKPMPGSQNPKLNGKQCFGYDLSDISVITLFDQRKLDFSMLFNIFHELDLGEEFFISNFFEKLAGTESIRKALLKHSTPKSVYDSWKEELIRFNTIRKKYLLYEDFDSINGRF